MFTSWWFQPIWKILGAQYTNNKNNIQYQVTWNHRHFNKIMTTCWWNKSWNSNFGSLSHYSQGFIHLVVQNFSQSQYQVTFPLCHYQLETSDLLQLLYLYTSSLNQTPNLTPNKNRVLTRIPWKSKTHKVIDNYTLFVEVGSLNSTVW